MPLRDRDTVPPGGFRYLQAETGAWIRGASFHTLLNNVALHRRANGFPVGTNFNEEIEAALCAIMPPGVCDEAPTRYAIHGTAVPGTVEPATGWDGSAHWASLHKYALSYQPQNQARAQRWLEDFASSLPCGQCRNGWRQWYSSNPADLTGAESFFRWTVTAHNAVNTKLGRNQWTEQDALARWK